MVTIRRAKTSVALYVLVILFVVFAVLYRPINTDSLVVSAKYQNFRFSIILIAFFASFALLSDVISFFSKKVIFREDGISANGAIYKYEEISRILIKKGVFSWGLEIDYSPNAQLKYDGLLFSKEEIRSIKLLAGKKTKLISPLQ